MGPRAPVAHAGAGRDEGGDAFDVVEIEQRQPTGVGCMVGDDGNDVFVVRGQRLLGRRGRRRTSILAIGAFL